MTEQWIAVPDWEHRYEISDQGRLRSVPRLVEFTDGRRSYTRPSRIVGGWVTHGYRRVVLSEPGRRREAFIHSLVLEAFVGPRPAGADACHWDGDKQNNRLENLRWGTRSENCYDTVRQGGNHNAVKTHCVNGHEYTPENTGRQQGGRRFCLECQRTNQREKNRVRNGFKPRVYWDDATHCKRGHERTPENTYTNPNNPVERSCRECRRIASAERYRRRMEASLA